jgi:hypothetical protein
MELLQLGVFGFGLLQDGDFGVSVFPQGEEILKGTSGFGRVALNGVGTCQAQALGYFLSRVSA